MAQPQQTLGRNPTVGYDAQNGRHKQGYYTLHGIKQPDVATQPDTGKVSSHRSQVSSPHGKLQEVHHNQSKFYIHTFYIICTPFSPVPGNRQTNIAKDYDFTNK